MSDSRIKTSDGSLQRVIGDLRKYLESRSEVILAFLFGSLVRNTYGCESDVDVAVYLSEGGNEISIWCGIEAIVRREVDLVVLNRAIPTVAWESIRGIPLVIKDRNLYLDLMLSMSREAEDLMEFNIDMWRQKEEIRCQS